MTNFTGGQILRVQLLFQLAERAALTLGGL